MKSRLIEVFTLVRSAGGSEGTMYGSVVIVLALVILTSITIVEPAIAQDAGCTLSINYANGDLKEPQPLLLSNKNGSVNFVQPIDELGTIKLKTGENILIACPGRGNYIQGINGLNDRAEIEARCLRGKTFTSSSKRINFSTLSCKFLPKHVALRTGNECYKNAAHVEIGFALEKAFIRTIEVCRDDETMMTYWTKFRLSPNIDGFQSKFPRPYKWQTGNFYPRYNIERQYQPSSQAATIANQLGSLKLANRYIDPKANQYLARGHLTAKADFIYGSAQSSTFWYLNAAPQWQSFNAGNWNTLEGNVRKYVTQRTSDLEVYTGTFGHTSLPDINDNEVPLYLYADGDERAFPVPKFFWKIIYDPLAKKATSFVGYNDPWMDNITDDVFLCNDVSHRIKWLRWQPNDIEKGVSYACKVDDLRKAIPSIPHLTVHDILT